MKKVTLFSKNFFNFWAGIVFTELNKKLRPENRTELSASELQQVHYLYIISCPILPKNVRRIIGSQQRRYYSPEPSPIVICIFSKFYFLSFGRCDASHLAARTEPNAKACCYIPGRPEIWLHSFCQANHSIILPNTPMTVIPQKPSAHMPEKMTSQNACSNGFIFNGFIFVSSKLFFHVPHDWFLFRQKFLSPSESRPLL